MVAVETGGRVTCETCEIVETLANVKVQSLPLYLRGSAAKACERVWKKLLALAAASSFAASSLFIQEALALEAGVGAAEVWLQHLLAERRFGDCSD